MFVHSVQTRSEVAVPAAVWYWPVVHVFHAVQTVFWDPVQPPLANDPLAQPVHATHTWFELNCPVGQLDVHWPPLKDSGAAHVTQPLALPSLHVAHDGSQLLHVRDVTSP